MSYFCHVRGCFIHSKSKQQIFIFSFQSIFNSQKLNFHGDKLADWDSERKRFKSKIVLVVDLNTTHLFYALINPSLTARNKLNLVPSNNFKSFFKILHIPFRVTQNHIQLSLPQLLETTFLRKWRAPILLNLIKSGYHSKIPLLTLLNIEILAPKYIALYSLALLGHRFWGFGGLTD